MKPIKFGASHEDLLRRIEKVFPVQTKSIDNIITRIHEQYPAVDRSTISAVVHTFFASIRTELLSGKIINLLKYFPSMGIFTYAYKNIPAIKVKIKTPESLR